MISDEMRELLSAYVDGELPHGEAARVEEAAKRDPRLRRRIQAYRRLSETLRVWDVEEHGQYPSRAFKERVLARVRTHEAERRHEFGGGVAAWWPRPAALAAGVLIALGLGALAAMLPGEPAAETARVARSVGESLAPVAAYGDYEVDPGPAPAAWEARAPRAWPTDAFEELLRDETIGLPVQMDGETFYMPNRRTLERFLRIQNLEREFAEGGPRNILPETRTGTLVNVALARMVEGYEARATGSEGLVAVGLPAAAKANVAMRAAPAWSEAGAAEVEAGALVAPEHHLRVKGEPVITLAGEVWIEPVATRKGAAVGRSRIVTGTSWVKSSELVPMAWASEVASAEKAQVWCFRAESFVLGPKARRELLGKRGRDEKALAWIASRFREAGLVEAARSDAKRTAAAVRRMVDQLRSDRRATGFAVHGEKGELLGVELFASHDLMVEFAPRLLRGYLLEADGRIELRATKGESDAAVARVQKFLTEETPRNAQRIEDVLTWEDEYTAEWPKGMRQVNLVSPTREIIGHGLLLDDTILQLTLFGN